jgi:mono/diheme cytochrome c family protein
MHYLKIGLILIASGFYATACLSSQNSDFVIGASTAYEATLYRQNCAICHGPEGEGRRLEDGTIVPSLRTGEFKAQSEAQIYKQIADGGNGMLPFRRQLSDREINLLTTMVQRDLRGGQ